MVNSEAEAAPTRFVLLTDFLLAFHLSQFAIKSKPAGPPKRVDPRSEADLAIPRLRESDVP